jgi:excisionase family DNA binding protein
MLCVLFSVSEVIMKLLRLGEVAEMLDVPPARVYEMARRGLLPVVRMGRQVRVDPEQLETWIEAGGQPLPVDDSSDVLFE